MFDELPVSQRKFVYISRTLLPSCLFVIDVESFPLNEVLIVGLVGPFEIVLDRLENSIVCALGVVRATEPGWWYAYVINSARDRRTSGVKLHFTKLESASMKHGNTSWEKISAFKASRNLLTMPYISVSNAGFWRESVSYACEAVVES